MSNFLDKILRVDYSLPKFECLDEYWLNKPFAKAVITKDEYIVVEPPLSRRELDLLEGIKFDLRRSFIVRDPFQIVNKEDVLFREFVKRVKGFDVKTIGKLWYYLRRDSIGYGKIDPILRDRNVEDISCSGYDLPVYVYHRAYGSLKTNIKFSRNELDDFVLKLAHKANVQLSLENPIADSMLPTGERIQLTYKSVVSTRGSSFSIRRSKEEPITPVDLIAWKTATPEIMAFLWLCVEARKNVLIIGQTASGKTTLLNAISMFIPKNSKIVSIEDTRELRLPHENWIPFIAKDFDGMFELLKASLRQRPEYILLGEIRGREALVLFQAMSTGHASYSTLHARDVKSAVNRLVNDPINVPKPMFESLDYIVALEMKWRGGRIDRRVRGVYEMHGTDYEPMDEPDLSGFEVFEDPEKEFSERIEFLRKMVKERPNAMEFFRRINDYAKRSYKTC